MKRLLTVIASVTVGMLVCVPLAGAINRGRARELATHAIRKRCGSYFYHCDRASLDWLQGPRPRKYHVQYFFLGYTYETRNNRVVMLFRRRHPAMAAGLFLPKYKTCVVTGGIDQWGHYVAPRKACVATGGQA